MTASVLTVAAFDAALKEIYPDGVPENLAARKRVLLSKMPKKDDFEGDALVIPVVGGNPTGASHTIATAVSYAYYGGYKKFTLTRVRDFQEVGINCEAIKASRSKKGAFLEAKKAEIDGMLSNLGHRLNIALYGAGDRSIGRIESGYNGNTWHLYNHDDCWNFQLGQTITTCATKTGSAVKAGSTYITAIDESTGSITVNDYAGITGTVANDDYIYALGDYDLGISGLAAWIPYTAPSASESFFGVDRSDHTIVYAGHRLDASSMTLEEGIMQISEQICKTGGGDSLTCLVNHSRFNELSKGLGSKIEYDGGGGDAEFGFKGFKIYTSGGVTTVFPDPDCPSSYAYVLTMDAWTLHSLGPVPHLVDDDGNMAVRSTTADTILVRGRWYGQLACKAPAWNGVLYLG